MRASHDGGFTFVELMIVLLILGVLTSIAVASFVSASASSQRVGCLSNQRVLIGAVRQYEVVHDGSLPDEIAELAPFARNFDTASACPGDGRSLVYDAGTGDISCTYAGHSN